MNRYYAVISDSGAVRDIFKGLKTLNEYGYGKSDNTVPYITKDYYEYGYEIVCGLNRIKSRTGLTYNRIKEMAEE